MGGLKGSKAAPLRALGRTGSNKVFSYLLQSQDACGRGEQSLEDGLGEGDPGRTTSLANATV